MSSYINEYMLRMEMHRLELAGTIKRGLIGVVRAYYENYTDATEVEPEVAAVLGAVIEYTALGQTDLYTHEIIVEAEKLINESGGIMSDTDGTRHLVKTEWAWTEVSDEDDEEE